MNNNETESAYRSNKLQKISKTAWITTIIFKWFAWAITLTFVIVGIVLCIKEAAVDGRSLIACALDVLLASFIILLLERILKEVKDGNTPFTWKNADRIRNIARLQLVLALWSDFREITMPVTVELENVTTTDGYAIMTSSTTITIMPLFVALIVYVLAFIFEYGVRLQQQADETL